MDICFEYHKDKIVFCILIKIDIQVVHYEDEDQRSKGHQQFRVVWDVVYCIALVCRYPVKHTCM